MVLVYKKCQALASQTWYFHSPASLNLKEFITVFFPIFLSSGVLELKQIHAGSD